MLASQLVISYYIGYFGAGAGLLTSPPSRSAASTASPR